MRLVKDALVSALLLVVPVLGQEKIPAIDDVPEGLCARSAELIQAHAAVEGRRSTLLNHIKDHNGRCRGVPTGTPEAQKCATAQAAVEGEKNSYVDAVKAFNRDLEATSLQCKCAQVANAQAEVLRLREEIKVDQQVIRNFGFEQTTEQIEQWGAAGEEARRKLEKTRKETWNDFIAWTVTDGVSNLATHALPAHRARQMSTKLTELLQNGSVPTYDELYGVARRIGNTEGAGIGAEEAKRLADRIRAINITNGIQKNALRADDMSTDGSMGCDPDSLEVLKLDIEIASLFNPKVELLSLDMNTLSLAVYGTESAVARQKINSLTTLTEAQLKDLESRTKILKQHGQDLAVARQLLQMTHPEDCDSTRLVCGAGD